MIDFDFSSQAVYGTLTLPLEKRIESRLKTCLDNGEEVGLFLERGLVLKNGDRLIAQSGEMVEVCAADEQLSTLRILMIRC